MAGRFSGDPARGATRKLHILGTNASGSEPLPEYRAGSRDAVAHQLEHPPRQNPQRLFVIDVKNVLTAPAPSGERFDTDSPAAAAMTGK